jgi:hypothetical protein
MTARCASSIDPVVRLSLPPRFEHRGDRHKAGRYDHGVQTQIAPPAMYPNAKTRGDESAVAAAHAM